jgi:hypothetical protein
LEHAAVGLLDVLDSQGDDSAAIANVEEALIAALI